MKKALLLFNLNAHSTETEEMHARNCELALSQMFPGTEWLVRTGKEDGEMRMKRLNIDPETGGWKTYFNRWMKDVHTPDNDGDTYCALIIGHEDGGLGRANANITNQVWTTLRYSGGHHGAFIMQNDGSLKVASHYSKVAGDNWAGVCGRLV